MQVDRPLNLIWRRGVLDIFLEARFIGDVLLSGLDRPLRWLAVEDEADLPVIDDVLVCSFGDTGNYLRQLRRAGAKNLGVFHFGDETGTDDTAFYAEADYVLRHYHFAERLTVPGGHCQDVIWVPNGWAGGVGPASPERILPHEARTHALFFAGYAGDAARPVGERHDMLTALRRHRLPATVILSGGFAQGLGAASYTAYMADARAALVPAGNSPETIRLYDALEWGAVPIIKDRPWLKAVDGLGALGMPPLVTLPDWHELPVAMTQIADQGKQIVADQMDWWSAFKDHQRRTVAGVVEHAFDRAG